MFTQVWTKLDANPNSASQKIHNRKLKKGQFSHLIIAYTNMDRTRYKSQTFPASPDFINPFTQSGKLPSSLGSAASMSYFQRGTLYSTMI